MRTIKLILLAIILIAIVLLAVANRQLVTVELLPQPLDQVLEVSVQVPLFLVGLICILVGMVLGYIFEWLREHKYRRRAAQKSREAEQLSRELDRTKKASKSGDDVLALID